MIVQPVEIVQVSEAVLALERFLESDLTSFFAATDFWSYENNGDNVCTLCGAFNNEIMSGDLVQSTFGDLEIIDSMTIAVNVHPNCKCLLKRVVRVGESFYHVHPSP